MRAKARRKAGLIHDQPTYTARIMSMGDRYYARIVHHWGGTIRVTSKPGEGTTFYFTLPDTASPPL